MADFKKIDFVFENATGGTDIKPVTIKKMKFEAFHQVLAIVNDIYGILQQDAALKMLFEEIFQGEPPIDEEVLATFTEEERTQMKKDRQLEAERRFIQGLMGAFPLLTVHLPLQATALLVAMTGVDEKELKEQDFDVVLDVYDACIEVNKIEALVDRVKKSLDATKQALAFMSKRRQATAK